MAAAANRRRGAWRRVQRDSHMARQRVSGTGHGKGGEKRGGGEEKGNGTPRVAPFFLSFLRRDGSCFYFLKPFQRLFLPKLEWAGRGKAEGGGGGS